MEERKERNEKSGERIVNGTGEMESVGGENECIVPRRYSDRWQNNDENGY